MTVIGIEKLSMLGGNWAINSGIVFAPATDAMKAAGDKDERTGQEDTIESAVAGGSPAPGEMEIRFW